MTYTVLQFFKLNKIKPSVRLLMVITSKEKKKKKTQYRLTLMYFMKNKLTQI